MYKESSNQQLVQALTAQVTFDAHKEQVSLSGAWLWSAINEEEFALELKRIQHIKAVTVNGQYIDEIDTTGIYFIVRLLKYLKKHRIGLTKLELRPDDQKLFDRQARAG